MMNFSSWLIIRFISLTDKRIITKWSSQLRFSYISVNIYIPWKPITICAYLAKPLKVNIKSINIFKCEDLYDLSTKSYKIKLRISFHTIYISYLQNSIVSFFNSLHYIIFVKKKIIFLRHIHWNIFQSDNVACTVNGESRYTYKEDIFKIIEEFTVELMIFSTTYFSNIFS